MRRVSAVASRRRVATLWRSTVAKADTSTSASAGFAEESEEAMAARLPTP